MIYTASVIEAEVSMAKEQKIIAVEPHFDVLEETEDWIAVNKAAPLIIHPTSKKKEPTLLCGLRELLRFELENGSRLSIINRLDRETSGVVLVAKNAQAAREINLQMQSKHIRKEYLALIDGWPEKSEWSVDAPLIRAGEVEECKIWLKQKVHSDGKKSRTIFEVQQRLKDKRGRPVSLVRCLPITGRMHQIRVHLQVSGHYILGDKIYGTDEQCYLDFMETGWTPELESKLSVARHLLHAEVLEFSYQSKQYKIVAPAPKDFYRSWKL